MRTVFGTMSVVFLLTDIVAAATVVASKIFLTLGGCTLVVRTFFFGIPKWERGRTKIISFYGGWGWMGKVVLVVVTKNMIFQ